MRFFLTRRQKNWKIWHFRGNLPNPDPIHRWLTPKPQKIDPTLSGSKTLGQDPSLVTSSLSHIFIPCFSLAQYGYFYFTKFTHFNDRLLCKLTEKHWVEHTMQKIDVKMSDSFTLFDKFNHFSKKIEWSVKYEMIKQIISQHKKWICRMWILRNFQQLLTTQEQIKSFFFKSIQSLMELKLGKRICEFQF